MGTRSNSVCSICGGEFPCKVDFKSQLPFKNCIACNRKEKGGDKGKPRTVEQEKKKEEKKSPNSKLPTQIGKELEKLAAKKALILSLLEEVETQE